MDSYEFIMFKIFKFK